MKEEGEKIIVEKRFALASTEDNSSTLGRLLGVAFVGVKLHDRLGSFLPWASGPFAASTRAIPWVEWCQNRSLGFWPQLSGTAISICQSGVGWNYGFPVRSVWFLVTIVSSVK
jgi:hypothetical protein